MRKLYLIASILLLSSVWLVAQSTPAQQPSTDQSSPSSAYPSQSSPSQASPSQSTAPDTSQTSSNSTSIEGCLAGSSGNYTLTDSTGKSWQLAGDTSKLTEHVGHQVRLSGSEAGGAAGAGGSASSSAGASASAGAGGSSTQSTFTVQKVKMISSSCPTK